MLMMNCGRLYDCHVADCFFCRSFLGYRQVIRKARSNSIMVQKLNQKIAFLKDVLTQLEEEPTAIEFVRLISRPLKHCVEITFVV